MRVRLCKPCGIGLVVSGDLNNSKELFTAHNELALTPNSVATSLRTSATDKKPDLLTGLLVVDAMG